MIENLRKLKAVWSMEAQQDLRIMHNIDAEALLTEMIAREINAEIDRSTIESIDTFFMSEEERWSDPQYYGYFPDDPSQYITVDDHYHEHRSESAINWQKEGF